MISYETWRQIRDCCGRQHMNLTQTLPWNTHPRCMFQLLRSFLPMTTRHLPVLIVILDESAGSGRMVAFTVAVVQHDTSPPK